MCELQRRPYVAQILPGTRQHHDVGAAGVQRARSAFGQRHRALHIGETGLRRLAFAAGLSRRVTTPMAQASAIAANNAFIERSSSL